MEIAVLSDTHLHSLTDEFIKKVETIAGEVDCFFHLGDSVSTEVLDFLNGYKLYAVAGNMDPQKIAGSYQVKRVVSLSGFRFGLMHGWGSPQGLDIRVAQEFADEQVDMVCFGHSHKALLKTYKGILLFNPGAVSAGRTGSTYGRITITDNKISARHLGFYAE